MVDQSTDPVKEIRRRDALMLLAGGSVLTATGIGISERKWDALPTPGTSLETGLITISTAVFPSPVRHPEETVERYLGAITDRRRREITQTLSEVDTHARRRFGRPLAGLSESESKALLRDIGVHRVRPRQRGTLAERVRFYLVNGLLLALFTHPRGSGLVDIQNPRGFPGGYRSALEESDE